MIGDILVRVGADIGEYNRKMKAAGESTQAFGKNVAATSGAIASAFAGITVASATAVGFVVKAASDYESAFAGVRKTTDATEAEFAKISKGIRDMAKEIPATTEEIAGVAEAAGQLGIKKDDILKFTRVMSDLGVTTNMSATDAAKSLARFANITGMSMDDVDRLGSTVVHLGNNLATTEREIVEMGLRLAGAGRQVGLTEAQILSFAGSLSAVGIRAEAGGSAFSRVFLTMSSAVKGGGDELVAFAKVAGMSAGEFKKAFEKDAAGATMSFIKGIDKISKSGGDAAQALSKLGLGEIRVRDALLRAAGASDMFTESLELGNTAWSENTALTNEAEERYKTFASKIQILKNRFKDMILIIGAPLMDALSAMLDKIDPLISMLEGWAKKFEEADEKTQRLVANIILAVPIIAALATAIFGLIAFLGLVVVGFGALKVAAAGVGASILALLGKVGLLAGMVSLIPILAGLAVAIILNWDKVKAKTIEMVDTIKRKLPELWNGFVDTATKVKNAIYDMLPQPVVDAIEKGIELIGNAFERLKEIIRNMLNGDFSDLTEVFKTIAPTIIGYIIGGIPGIIVAASRYLPAIAEGLTSNIDLIGDAIQSIITGIVEFLSTYAPQVLEAGIEIVETILSGIVEAAPLIMEGATFVILSLIEALTELIPMILEAGVLILTTLLEGLVANLPLIVEGITKVIEMISYAVSLLLPTILTIGTEILMTILEGIVEMLPVLIEAGIGIIETLTNSILELLPTILEAGIAIVLAIVDGIVEALPQIIEAAADLISSIIDTVLDLLPDIVAAGVKVLLALVEGILAQLPTLITAVLTLIASLLGTIVIKLPQIIAAGVNIVVALVAGLIKAIPQIIAAAGRLMLELLKAIGKFVSKMALAGIDLVLGLVRGVGQMAKTAWNAFNNLAKSGWEAVKGYTGKIVQTGKDIALGFANGIKDKMSVAVDKAQEMGSKVWNSVKSFFKVKSPSRLFRFDLGRQLGAGMVLGLDDSIRPITKAALRLAEAATPEMPKLGGFDDVNMRSIKRKMSSEINAEVSQDESYIGSVLAEVRDELKEQSEELRKQKQMIVELDGRSVGRAIEPHIKDRQDIRQWRKEAF